MTADILLRSRAVAQLARASACHAEGRGFESLQPLVKGPLMRVFCFSGWSAWAPSPKPSPTFVERSPSVSNLHPRCPTQSCASRSSSEHPGASTLLIPPGSGAARRPRRTAREAQQRSGHRRPTPPATTLSSRAAVTDALAMAVRALLADCSRLRRLRARAARSEAVEREGWRRPEGPEGSGEAEAGRRGRASRRRASGSSSEPHARPTSPDWGKISGPRNQHRVLVEKPLRGSSRQGAQPL